MLKLNFLKIGSRCVRMASFSTALAPSDWCSFCPQWGKTRSSVPGEGECGGLQLARAVCGACGSRWMRMAGWPDPTLGTTSQWRDRTWICVVPEKCWSRVEMFCSYWSFVKLAWPVVFSLKKRKLKTGLQRWLRGDALVLEVWRPELRSPAPSKSQARRHALVILLLEERQRKLDGI